MSCRLALALCSFGFLSLMPAPEAQAKSKASPTKKDEAKKRAAQLDRYFGICDLDKSSWISFREASATMGISKSEFRSLDNDNDGRFTSSEFREHGTQVLSLLGAFPQKPPSKSSETTLPQNNRGKQGDLESTKENEARNPLLEAFASDKAGVKGRPDLAQLLAGAKETSNKPGTPAIPSPTTPGPRLPPVPYPSPQDMLASFDRDKSGGLSRGEVSLVLARVKATLSADVIVDRTDHNSNGELETTELGPLSFMISRRLPKQGLLFHHPEGTTGAEQLSWGQKNAKPFNGLTVVGQFSHFSRLDSDGDGMIDSKDLRQKLTQSHSSIRASAIVSALDGNGDGSIDPEEFLFAMRGRD